MSQQPDQGLRPRLLLQTYPPSLGEDSGEDSTEATADQSGVPQPVGDLELSVREQDRWEGLYRLADGRSVPFQAHRVGQQVHVWMGGESFVFAPPASSSRGRGFQQISTDEILCSVPGVVIGVHVAEGDTVVAGQDLLVLESMKTEQVVKSPRDGTVQRVPVTAGDRVDRGMRLVLLVPLEN